MAFHRRVCPTRLAMAYSRPHIVSFLLTLTNYFLQLPFQQLPIVLKHTRITTNLGLLHLFLHSRVLLTIFYCGLWFPPKLWYLIQAFLEHPIWKDVLSPIHTQSFSSSFSKGEVFSQFWKILSHYLSIYLFSLSSLSKGSNHLWINHLIFSPGFMETVSLFSLLFFLFLSLDHFSSLVQVYWSFSLLCSVCH